MNVRELFIACCSDRRVRNGSNGHGSDDKIESNSSRRKPARSALMSSSSVITGLALRHRLITFLAETPAEASWCDIEALWTRRLVDEDDFTRHFAQTAEHHMAWIENEFLSSELTRYDYD
jgi:hypothetical protein